MKYKSDPHNWYLYTLLFVTYLLYRLYFWGDIGQHYPHAVLNALGDAIISVITGLGILRLKSKTGLAKSNFYFSSTAIVVGAIIVLYLYHYVIYYLFGQLNAGFDSMFKAVCFQLLDSVAIVIIGSFSTIMDVMKTERFRIERELNQLERENLSVELKYLKAQLDPHFIFNSLNTIFYQLPAKEVAVRQSVSEFSDILRYHMKSNLTTKISIQEEIKYIESYVQFNSKRQKDFVTVKTTYDIEEQSYVIEPLLLLPLVENAFKFCSAEDDKTGEIDIQISVKNKVFEFQLSNTFQPEELDKSEGEGIGLANVRKRLDLSYNKQHRFETRLDIENKTFTCNLRIWA